MMPHTPDQRLDVFAGNDQPQASSRRRWLGIHFECCDVYLRVYKNRPGTAYVGFCPRCGRRVRVPVGPEGTDARFFTAR